MTMMDSSLASKLTLSLTNRTVNNRSKGQHEEEQQKAKSEDEGNRHHRRPPQDFGRQQHQRQQSQEELSSWGLLQTLTLLIALCSLGNTWLSITNVLANNSGSIIGDNEVAERAYTDSRTTIARARRKASDKATTTTTTTTRDDGTGKQGLVDSTRSVDIKNRKETTTHDGWKESGIIRPGKLSCKAHGGPTDRYSREMVYWRDIPSDRRGQYYIGQFRSNNNDVQQHHQRPATSSQKRKKYYLTFEPDEGGWNNIRMAMETVLGLALATGRTLVLPPEQGMYLIQKNHRRQKHKLGFADFFPLKEFDGFLDVITMREFLETEAMSGNLRDKRSGRVTFPPNNRTDWDGAKGAQIDHLNRWLRNATRTPLWSPQKCVAAFPANNGGSVKSLTAMHKQIIKSGRMPKTGGPIKRPIPVNAGPAERMRESMAERDNLCLYDDAMQRERVLHFMCNYQAGIRMLVHFYAFLYFEDWRQDVWTKRFVRDRVRYKDEIQCAAARVVRALRAHAAAVKRTTTNATTGGSGSNNNVRGEFDSMHVRRGDFQFKSTRISAEELYANTKDVLGPPGSVIYIATDERNKTFFDPLRRHYDLKFLDDFVAASLLKGINTNYYGMIDQLVASRGRVFVGCYKSTFSGYIHRIRGYHSTKDKLPGYDKGLLLDSYYYAPLSAKNVMREYHPVWQHFFNREFPTSWRGLDEGI